MITETQADKIIVLLERIALNYPAREDVRFFSGDTDVVLAATTLTVTWILRTDFEIVITEMYADVRTDCDYWWSYGGVIYNINEVTLPYGKRVGAGEDRVVLKISNTGAVDQEIGYYIKGWARRIPV